MNDSSSVRVCEEESSSSNVDQVAECQHPSFDLDILDPILTEDDIPGAKLDMNILQTYTKDELKLWLSTRGLHVSGNKPELIQRYCGFYMEHLYFLSMSHAFHNMFFFVFF